MAIQAADAVRATQSPWMHQTWKKRSGFVLISSKRPSVPARCTRAKRNEPRRAAHTTTIAARIHPRASCAGASRARAIETAMKVRLPVRSKNRSVRRRAEGRKTTNWMTKAAVTAIANTGMPPTCAPRKLPATASPAPMTRATTTATSAVRFRVAGDRSEVGGGTGAVMMRLLCTGCRSCRRRGAGPRGA